MPPPGVLTTGGPSSVPSIYQSKFAVLTDQTEMEPSLSDRSILDYMSILQRWQCLIGGNPPLSSHPSLPCKLRVCNRNSRRVFTGSDTSTAKFAHVAAVAGTLPRIRGIRKFIFA
jgi:hypothetical protein